MAVILREAETADRDAVRPIVESWVRGRVTGRLLANEADRIIATVGTRETQHIIAVDTGIVIGMMGLTTPDTNARRYATSANAAELVHAFLVDECRGRGIGTLLVNGLEAAALLAQSTELIIQSGPRYEHSGWPFWSARFGSPVAVEHHRRGDVAVWRKVLTEDWQ